MRAYLQHLTGQLTFRLFLSHVMVAILTGVCLTMILFVLIWHFTKNPSGGVYELAALNYGMMWLAGMPDGQPSHPEIDPMPGWTLIVAKDQTIAWSRGDTACRAGMTAESCVEWRERGDQRGLFIRDGKPWALIEIPLITGDTIVMGRGQITAEPYLIYGDFVIMGYANLFWFELVSRGVMALPIALLLAWLFMRPQAKRLNRITQASRAFAAGDLNARARDTHGDEVGRLAQQFDDMADALTQNIHTLQDLALRNSELAAQAEQSAIKAERARISRDLHDAIAQRLFSLSVSTTALPNMIEQDRQRGVQQARLIAEMAEQTLMDLRSLLVEMRPSNVSQRGLTESLQHLFRQWQTLHSITLESALMLTGRYIPAPLEDAIYQITQEALSNVARHAQATTVDFSLVEGRNQLVLSISDNGRGFDPQAQPQSAKFGLMSMRERAGMFGGRIDIESSPQGTTLEVCLPLATTD